MEGRKTRIVYIDQSEESTGKFGPIKGRENDESWFLLCREALLCKRITKPSSKWVVAFELFGWSKSKHKTFQSAQSQVDVLYQKVSFKVTPLIKLQGMGTTYWCYIQNTITWDSKVPNTVIFKKLTLFP